MIWQDASKQKPAQHERVLCYNEPSDRLFVGTFEWVYSGYGLQKQVRECWSDDECTYVSATHWALIQKPNLEAEHATTQA